MARLICEVCGSYSGNPHQKTCPFFGQVECRECLQEFPADELTDGLCDECSKEPCDECDGTGMSDEYDDEEGSLDCEICGGVYEGDDTIPP